MATSSQLSQVPWSLPVATSITVYRGGQDRKAPMLGPSAPRTGVRTARTAPLPAMELAAVSATPPQAPVGVAPSADHVLLWDGARPRGPRRDRSARRLVKGRSAAAGRTGPPARRSGILLPFGRLPGVTANLAGRTAPDRGTVAAARAQTGAPACPEVPPASLSPDPAAVLRDPGRRRACRRPWPWRTGRARTCAASPRRSRTSCELGGRGSLPALRTQSLLARRSLPCAGGSVPGHARGPCRGPYWASAWFSLPARMGSTDARTALGRPDVHTENATQRFNMLAVAEQSRCDRAPVLDPGVPEVDSGCNDDLVPRGPHLPDRPAGTRSSPAPWTRPLVPVPLGAQGSDVAVGHGLEALDHVAIVIETAAEQVE